MASSAPLEEFIICNICFEIYKHPKSLRCRHVYCHDCIQQLQQGSEVQCPDCRKVSLITDVENDFRTQSLIDEYNQQQNPINPGGSVRLCDICQEPKKVAKSFCKTCLEFLCNDCETYHRRFKEIKDHKLVELIDMMKEKQQDIEKEIRKLQDKRTDVHQNITSIDNFAGQLLKSKDKLIAEVNKHREDIKMRVDDHHDGLINKINSTIGSLQKTLKETKTLFAKCCSKLEENIIFLSDVSNGQDYSLMTDTLANLSEQIEKDLQQIDKELPKLDLPVGCPVEVLGGDKWDPLKSTQLKVPQKEVEITRQLTCQKVCNN